MGSTAGRGRRGIGRPLGFLAAAVALLALAAPAHAAFPGANGKWVTSGYSSGVYTQNPDGTGGTLIDSTHGTNPRWRPDGQKIAIHTLGNASGAWLMNPDGSDVQPLSTTNPNAYVDSWSPDGQEIAYRLPVDGYPDYDIYESQIATANADGTNETILTSGHWDRSPVWSPDGQKIAFVRAEAIYDSDCECFYEGPSDIWIMNTDGTALTNLTENIVGGIYKDEPNWSPDGQRIAFSRRYTFSDGDVFTMNADGTGFPHYTGAYKGRDPVWSPDGEKIAFRGYYNNTGPFIMNADGSGITAVNGSVDDWQPLPTASYHHPQSASQLRVSLVPAFKPCGTGGNPSNAKHASPLATSSCNPPKPSVLAAIGISSQSSAQMTVVPGDTDPTNGNQANVAISASLTDIQAVAGGDYNPNPSGADLTAVTRLRLTDKANGYGGLPATATEYDFKVPIDCSSTPDPSVGSTCTANTTANALIAGLIQERRQAIVQAFRVRIDDSGANGIRGDSDDRIFATQGVFVP